jgi:hypothetical protein
MSEAWRDRHVFTPGTRYRVRRDFSDAGYDFKGGEILIFESDGYVPYDSSFVYQFQSESGPKLWSVGDTNSVGDPVNPAHIWQHFFEAVP